MSWQELRFVTAYAEFAEEVLEARGALSVSMLPPENSAPVLEPAPGETPLWERVQVTALFAAGASLDAVRDALRDTLPDGEALRFDTGRVEDRDWIGQCRDAIQAMRFGRRLWVRPQHRQVDAPDGIVVTLDPGLAFGTGTHPTTALCLQWLDAHPPTALRVLDYGCGSGILAVAAAKLGAAEVVAVDIDPQAVRATQENARINEVADRLRVMLSDDFTAGTFDVVIANILTQPLLALAPLLGGSCRTGGRLALAGLLDRQADEVRAAYPEFALEGQSLEGWTRLSGQKKPA